MARRGHEKANELKVCCQLKVTGGPREQCSSTKREKEREREGEKVGGRACKVDEATTSWEGATTFAHKRLRNILASISTSFWPGTFFGTQKLTRKILKKILNKKIM